MHRIIQTNDRWQDIILKKNMLKNTYINFEFFDDWSDHDKSKCMQIYSVFKFKINKTYFANKETIIFWF